MSDITKFRVVRRSEIAALLQREYGTDQIAWSTEPGPDDTPSPRTWLSLFVAEPTDGDTIAGRQDIRFFDVRIRRRIEGYNQLVLFEEPKVPFPANNRPRVVGYIRVYVNLHGFVKTRSETTLMGETLMIHPTSISKDEAIEDGAVLLATTYFNANPQRIEGSVEVEILQMDFPDDEEGARKVREVVVMTTDGRTLSVSAKIMAFANA